MAGYFVLFDIKITVLLTVLFILYEVWESIRIHDTGYLELREFIFGVYVGLIVTWIVYTLAMTTNTYSGQGCMLIRVRLWR